MAKGPFPRHHENAISSTFPQIYFCQSDAQNFARTFGNIVLRSNVKDIMGPNATSLENEKMKFQFDSPHLSRIWVFFFAALAILITGVLMVPSFEAASADLSATYTHGVLHVAIPYRAPRAG